VTPDEALAAAIGPLASDPQVVREIEDRWQVPTYAKLDIALARGEGSTVEDVQGRRYLDLYGGHCVALLGHNPARVVDAIFRDFVHRPLYRTGRERR